MITWTLISIVGVWFVHRTLIEIENLKLISTEKQTEFRIASYSLYIFVCYIFKNSTSGVIFINLLILCGPVVVPFVILRFRSQRAKKTMLATIDNLVLSMKSGQSFRMAVKEAMSNADFHLKILLEEFLSAAQFKKEPPKWSFDSELNSFLHELWLVDGSTTRQIELLLAFRRKLSLISNFRQRSRQALLQTRAQSLVTAFIYLLVLIYVNFKFSLGAHLNLLIVSLLFFSIGFITTWRMGRRYRWKI
jgi:hypothetical protein